MNIYSLLTEETILTDMRVKDKEALLNRLIDLLSDQVTDKQLSAIRSAVFEREKIMSTGVGKGLAIPHGKSAEIDTNYASFATLAEPIQYDSIDEKPVEVVFLLVGPESKNSAHIKLLSRISRLMNNENFRARLNDCTTPGEIIEVFTSEEDRHFEN
ncbi:MAG: PTS sugar transporter subunit IIA [Balneolaceae bacterium]